MAVRKLNAAIGSKHFHLATIIMTPPFPIIEIYRGKSIDMLNGEYPLDQTTLFGYIKRDSDESIYYDKAGFKWASAVYSPKYIGCDFKKHLTYRPTGSRKH